jgi:hypothetical protein
MTERPTMENPRFDDDLDRILSGAGLPGESGAGGDDYAMDLATARVLTAHFASLRHPPAEVGERIWRQTQQRIDAGRQPRLRPVSTIQPLIPFPRRRLVAVAAAILFLLSAITPVGPQVVATAQEVIAAWGWIERAPAPGDESTAVEIDETAPPPGMPTVGVDAVTIPYDPDTRDQIEPAGVPAGEPTSD